MNDILHSLEDTLLSDELKKIQGTLNPLSADYVDNALSEVFQDSIIGRLPVVKTVYTLAQTWHGINNYFLVEKLMAFLFQVREASVEERTSFLKKLEKKDKQEIFNQLVIVLDKHDRYIKSSIQGKLFTAMIRGSLPRKDYFSLTHSVNQIDVELLKIIKSFYVSLGSTSSFSDGDIYSLASLRLIGIDNSSVGTFDSNGIEYKGNRLGMFLVLIGLQEKIPFDYVELIVGKIEAKKIYLGLGYLKNL